jgi:site-specific DNA-methyltransferase (adenine-specific)
MSDNVQRVRGARNRTLTLSDHEMGVFRSKLIDVQSPVTTDAILGRTICGDMIQVLKYLPDQFIDLLFLDPPYNLDKTFNSSSFRKMDGSQYQGWLESWLEPMIRLLKPDASIYICGDWRSSSAIHNAAARFFQVRNRITFEREKGRGAKTNWKNCSEDIWFCTMSDDYTFDVEAVKLKRKVIAPYRDEEGLPKDWEDGFRLTAPSNLWTDITIPFWSMPENTDHPTQKPEKLLAKIILASSKPGAVVFDPFLGSGTTSVVAKKLGRQFAGIEIDEHYCCLAEKRLTLAEEDQTIQGYADGVFWERNTLNQQNQTLWQTKPD